MGKDIAPTPSGKESKGPSSIANGDISHHHTKSTTSSITGKLDSKSTASSSAGHTPVQKHRSVVSLPLPPDPAQKRDSSVFDMIAGTKSKSSIK